MQVRLEFSDKEIIINDTHMIILNEDGTSAALEINKLKSIIKVINLLEVV